MLLKSARLNIADNFKWVMGGGRCEFEEMKLFWRFGENSKPLIGVAVNSKEFKKAHLRVEAKRKAYEAARVVYGDLPEKLNLVIMPKSPILTALTDEIAGKIKNAKYRS